MQRKYSNTVIFWMLFGHLGGSLRTPIYWFDDESDINWGSFEDDHFSLKAEMRFCVRLNAEIKL